LNGIIDQYVVNVDLP